MRRKRTFEFLSSTIGTYTFFSSSSFSRSEDDDESASRINLEQSTSCNFGCAMYTHIVFASRYARIPMIFSQITSESLSSSSLEACVFNLDFIFARSERFFSSLLLLLSLLLVTAFASSEKEEERIVVVVCLLLLLLLCVLFPNARLMPLTLLNDDENPR
jgi:hypothetical protein